MIRMPICHLLWCQRCVSFICLFTFFHFVYACVDYVKLIKGLRVSTLLVEKLEVTHVFITAAINSTSTLFIYLLECRCDKADTWRQCLIQVVYGALWKQSYFNVPQRIWLKVSNIFAIYIYQIHTAFMYITWKLFRFQNSTKSHNAFRYQPYHIYIQADIWKE